MKPLFLIETPLMSEYDYKEIIQQLKSINDYDVIIHQDSSKQDYNFKVINNNTLNKTF